MNSFWPSTDNAGNTDSLQATASEGLSLIEFLMCIKMLGFDVGWTNYSIHFPKDSINKTSTMVSCFTP